MTKKEIRKRSESKGYSWFSWRRTNPEDADAPQNKSEEIAVKKEVSGSLEVLFRCFKSIFMFDVCCVHFAI